MFKKTKLNTTTLAMLMCMVMLITEFALLFIPAAAADSADFSVRTVSDNGDKPYIPKMTDGNFVIRQQTYPIDKLFKDTMDKYDALETKVKYKYVIESIDNDATKTKAMKKAASINKKGMLKTRKMGDVDIVLYKRSNENKTWQSVSHNTVNILDYGFKTNDNKGRTHTATYAGQTIDVKDIMTLSNGKDTVTLNDIVGAGDVVDSIIASGQAVCWKATGKAVSIDPFKGRITVNKKGVSNIITEITNTKGDRVQLKFKLVVKIPKFKKSTVKLQPGKSTTVKMLNEIKGVNEVVTLTTSNPNVVSTADTNKLIANANAKSGDTATITATMTDGQQYTCEVIIK